MEITEVRVKLMEEPGERLQAFCSITFDDAFVVRDLKIIEGTTGPFVAMPSRKLTAHCPQCGCKNHLRGPLQPMWRAAERGTLGQGRRRAGQTLCRHRPSDQHLLPGNDPAAGDSGVRGREGPRKLPGYMPTYDDFEPEAVGLPGAPRTTTVPPRIQGAEKPHGPHRAPRTSRRRNGWTM